MSLDQYRREYIAPRLRREELQDSPFDQFSQWLEQAASSPLKDPTAMSLATVGEDGKPWQRMVLLKHFDEKGLVFFTNLGSRKAHEISLHSQVSLLFPWNELNRQVIVGGNAEKLGRMEVVRYFLSRPRESQLAAWASRQSSPLSSRQALEAQFMQMKEKFSSGEMPVPDFWGGYRVVPDEFQFWQGGEHRLHDRFQYLLSGGMWQISRLAP